MLKKIIHAGGTSRKEGQIYTQSLKNIKESVKNGQKEFELDVRFNSNNELIFAHDLKSFSYYFCEEIKTYYPSNEEMRKQKGKIIFETFDTILNYLISNDCVVYLDIKEEKMYYDVIDKILSKYKCNSIYFQTFSLKQTKKLLSKYESINIFLNVHPYIDDFPSLDFLKQNRIKISVDINDLYKRKSILRKFLADVIKNRKHLKIKRMVQCYIDNDIETIVHVVNNEDEMKFLNKKGIKEIMTDYYD